MWKITATKPFQRALPEDIRLPNGFSVSRVLMPSNAGGRKKFAPAEHLDPIIVEMIQPLGHDRTLFELFQIVAGFGLKLTLSMPVEQSDGGMEFEDILDINIQDLVPDDFRIGDNVWIKAMSYTPPEFNWIKPPPPRPPAARPKVEKGGK